MAKIVRQLLKQGYHFPITLGDIFVPAGSHEIRYPLFPGRIVNGKISYWF